MHLRDRKLPPPKMDHRPDPKRGRSDDSSLTSPSSSKLTSVDQLPSQSHNRKLQSRLCPIKSSPSTDPNSPRKPYLESPAQPAAPSQTYSFDGLPSSPLVRSGAWPNWPFRIRKKISLVDDYIQDTSAYREYDRILRRKINETEGKSVWSSPTGNSNLLKSEREPIASGFQGKLLEKPSEKLVENPLEIYKTKPLEESTDKSLEKPLRRSVDEYLGYENKLLEKFHARRITMKRSLPTGEDPGNTSEKAMGKASNNIEETPVATSDNEKAFSLRSYAGQTLEKPLKELAEIPEKICWEKSPGKHVGKSLEMCLHTPEILRAERHSMHSPEENLGEAPKDTEETPWETLDSGKAFSFRSNAGKALEKPLEEIVEIPKGNCGAKSPMKHAGEFLEICLHTPEIRPAERRPMHPAEEDLGKASKDMEETPRETPDNGKAFSLWPVRRQEFLLRKQIQSELSMEREEYAKLLKKESQISSKLEEVERDLKSEKEINRRLRTDREDLKSKLNEVADDLNTERKVNGGFKKVKENFESRIKAMEGDLKVEVDLMTIMIKKERGSFELKLQKVEGSLNELSEINSSLVKEKEDFKSRLGELEDSLEKEQDKIVCQICFVQPRNAVCLPCMHFLNCHDCLQRHVKKKKSCPTCRASISGILQCLLSA